MDVADRYVDLVKHAVNGDLNAQDTVLVPVEPRGLVNATVGRVLAARGIVATRAHTIDESAYTEGAHGWLTTRSARGQSMIGLARLSNVAEAVESVIREDVPGDLIETGVWRGGATILMRAVLAARGVSDRTVYVADSFEGLPPTDLDDDAGDLHADRTLAVSVEQVRDNFARYGLLDEQVQFVKGWFRDTLPGLREHRWAVVRLDGDMYESTIDGLTNLYPGLSPGGWLIVDDYHTYESCRRAVEDYRREHRIVEPMVRIDQAGVYWRKR